MALKEWIVPETAHQWRIDRFLRSYCPELSSSIIMNSFARRDVKLDGKRVKSSVRISAGQNVKLYFTENTSEEFVFLDVVYENSDVLLVNKPAGISVEQDSGGGLSLTDLCVRHVMNQNLEGSFFSPLPCHRLDNRTCGLCLFAKNQRAYDILLDVFRKRNLQKYYYCVVRGFMKPTQATCRAFLTKDPAHGIVHITDHHVSGSREIITAYETIQNGPVSKLKVHLITGRTHQIRAHFASMGHPLLGDDVYGDRAFNRQRKARKLHLCACSLVLNTEGRLSDIDGRIFTIVPPF